MILSSNLVEHIQWTVEGAEDLWLNEDGNLHIQTPIGILIEEKPVSYQVIEGERQEVQSRFILKENEQGQKVIGVEVTGDVNPRFPLVIDPVLIYSSYLGGTGFDQGSSIAVDSSGNAFVTGITASPTGFPFNVNAFQPTFGGVQDAFVTKVDPNGMLVYSSYLGGSGQDQGNSIAVDSSGNAFVTGITASPTGFPFNVNAFQPTFGGFIDAFVTKIGLLCPADITVNNDPGQCGAIVNYPDTTVSDNCPGVTFACSPASGSFFPVGTTPVTCTATDAAGNTSSCSFTVTVIDAEPPTITCPDDITQENDPGQCGAIVSYPDPTVSDNCPGVTFACSPHLAPFSQ